jgi:hypothetical protein
VIVQIHGTTSAEDAAMVAAIRAAIDAVGPAGVDSETHTSRIDDWRRKDREKVRLFIERARSAP